MSQIRNEVGNGLEKVFDALDMKIDKPSLKGVHEFLRNAGVDNRTAQRISAGYMAYKSGKGSKEAIVSKLMESLSEITIISKKNFTYKDIKNWGHLSNAAQGAFIEAETVTMVGSQEMMGHVGRQAIFSALVHLDGNKAIIKSMGWKIDGKKGQWKDSRIDEEEVDEMTSNANVQGYNSPGAFSRNDDDSKKRQAQLTKIAHGTLAKSINESVTFKQLSSNPSNSTTHGGTQHFSTIDGKNYVWNYVEVKNGKYVVVNKPTDTIAVSTMAGKKLKVAKIVKESINEAKDEKEVVTALLIKYGNNPNDVKKMIDKHWEYVSSVYSKSPARKKAEVIRTIYESVINEIDTNYLKKLGQVVGKMLPGWNISVNFNLHGRHVIMAESRTTDKYITITASFSDKFDITVVDGTETEIFEKNNLSWGVLKNMIPTLVKKFEMNESTGCGCGCGCDGKKKLNENIYGEDGYEKWAEELKKGIKAPYVNVNFSTLGGKERASILFTVGLDSKDKWPNNILENSRYGKFHLGYDGVLEMHSARWDKVSKFRKSRVKSVKDVIAKIDKWFAASTSMNEVTNTDDYMGKAIPSSVIKKVKDSTHWNDHNEARVVLSKAVADALKDSPLNMKGMAALVKEYERIQKAHGSLKYMSPPLLNRRNDMDAILYQLLNRIPNGNEAKKAL